MPRRNALGPRHRNRPAHPILLLVVVLRAAAASAAAVAVVYKMLLPNRRGERRRRWQYHCQPIPPANGKKYESLELINLAVRYGKKNVIKTIDESEYNTIQKHLQCTLSFQRVTCAMYDMATVLALLSDFEYGSAQWAVEVKKILFISFAGRVCSGTTVQPTPPTEDEIGSEFNETSCASLGSTTTAPGVTPTNDDESSLTTMASTYFTSSAWRHGQL